MVFKRISTLNTYTDWLRKSKHDFDFYKERSSVYDLTNFLLKLNALPEWIFKSHTAPSNLVRVAEDKIFIVRGQNGFELDTNKSEGDSIIDRITISAKFPLTFSVKFNHLKVGDKNIHAVPVVESVISFWELEIQNS